MAGDTPGSSNGPGSDRGQLAWSFWLNSILVAAFVLGARHGPRNGNGNGNGTHSPNLTGHTRMAFLFSCRIFVQRWILGTAPSHEIEVVA